jgi:hypothetical protein
MYSPSSPAVDPRWCRQNSTAMSQSGTFRKWWSRCVMSAVWGKTRSGQRWGEPTRLTPIRKSATARGDLVARQQIEIACNEALQQIANKAGKSAEACGKPQESGEALELKT